MSKPLVSDELWALVAPVLPPEPPKPKGGRPRVSDRAALTGKRLATIKAQYDPDNVFHLNHNITPSSAGSSVPPEFPRRYLRPGGRAARRCTRQEVNRSLREGVRMIAGRLATS